jgi:hypothetical protein
MMAETDQILAGIDRITEELERVKTSLMIQAMGKKKQAATAWRKLVKTARHVRWDGLSAVEEIRQQRNRGTGWKAS